MRLPLSAVVPALALGAVLAPPSSSQDEGAAARAEQENAELRARLSDLEAWREELLYAEEGQGLGLRVDYEDVRATFQIFGDVGAQYHDPAEAGSGSASFALGTLDFFANVSMGDHFRALSETVVEVDSGGSTEISQERLSLSYVASDELYFKLGTDHSPISRWNELYHHGRWLETTVTRPVLVAFEGDGGVLPLHRTGLYVGGSHHTDSGRLSYFGTISNGRGLTPKDKQREGDVDDQKAIDLGIAYEPAGPAGLRFGLAVVNDRIPADPTSSDPLRMQAIDEQILTGQFSGRAGSLDFLSEAAFIHHEGRETGDEFDSTGGYLQLSRTSGTWTPYARFDFRNMEEGDPFYATLDRDLDVTMQSIGVRYDAHSNVAVKVELGFGKEDRRDGLGAISEEDVTVGLFQLSWWL